jgi:deoxyhypusine monooxygenase
MVQVEECKIVDIGRVLNDKNRPLKERFRALFTLKNIGGQAALEAINECFSDESALLKHELAYCMGQMQDVAAIPMLTNVLENVKHEPMVRHEAGNRIVQY